MPDPVALAPELTSILRPGVLWWDGAHVAERAEALDAALAEVVPRTVASPPAETQAVREMYRRVGLDPTKTRPSNEALLRRVRRGDPFPRVNALVDAVNLCSLEWQLPYGVYDRAALAGPIAHPPGRRRRGLRRHPQGHRARGRTAHRRRCPRPVRQPDVGFGAGDGDAATVDALIVVYAPVGTAARDVHQVLDRTAARVGAAVGGREADRWVA